MGRRKEKGKSGVLFRGKIPAQVMETVVSFESSPHITAIEIAEEIHTQRANVYRALSDLRRAGYVVYNGLRWRQPIRSTERGRAAVDALQVKEEEE